MTKRKISQRQIARRLAIGDKQTIIFEREIAKAVAKDQEVITHELGTFYLKKTQATRRKLNGVWYDVPAKTRIALRGKCVEEIELELCVSGKSQMEYGPWGDPVSFLVPFTASHETVDGETVPLVYPSGSFVDIGSVTPGKFEVQKVVITYSNLSGVIPVQWGYSDNPDDMLYFTQAEETPTDPEDFDSITGVPWEIDADGLPLQDIYFRSVDPVQLGLNFPQLNRPKFGIWILYEKL